MVALVGHLKARSPAAAELWTRRVGRRIRGEPDDDFGDLLGVRCIRGEPWRTSPRSPRSQSPGDHRCENPAGMNGVDASGELTELAREPRPRRRARRREARGLPRSGTGAPRPRPCRERHPLSERPCHPTCPCLPPPSRLGRTPSGIDVDGRRRRGATRRVVVPRAPRASHIVTSRDAKVRRPAQRASTTHI